MTVLGAIHSQLVGGLWHTTSPDRFIQIMARGGLEPEPDIPNSKRHKTAAGAEHYPYARSIGGVSLFDFTDFDPASYSEKYPLSSWGYFVPRVRDWPVAVWIEIDRESIVRNFVSTAQLLQNWKRDEKWHHTIMPMLEASCIGKLPLAAFASAFITWGDGSEIDEIDLQDFDPKAFTDQVNFRGKP